jgi:MFS family permease
MLHVI